ncbi:MAG TPA: hypothetical protein DCG48_07550 [Rhodospirillaceae bacterium]|nr:hypothetical protein [Rhodospirillaceae bacterium]|tara:strand:+ start:3751 stop:4275 length:525 start_codon:yes stop_codon:yes gene_type:complete
MKPDWNPDNLKPLVGHKICPIADALNLFATNEKEFRHHIEIDAKRYWHREALRVVPVPAMKIVDMVLDRTLGWSKVAEIITEDQFRNGVPHAPGKAPISTGTGQNEKTIRKYTRFLADELMMSRFPLKSRGRARYWYTPLHIEEIERLVGAYDDRNLWAACRAAAREYWGYWGL